MDSKIYPKSCFSVFPQAWTKESLLRAKFWLIRKTKIIQVAQKAAAYVSHCFHIWFEVWTKRSGVGWSWRWPSRNHHCWRWKPETCVIFSCLFFFVVIPPNAGFSSSWTQLFSRCRQTGTDWISRWTPLPPTVQNEANNEETGAATLCWWRYLEL